MIKDGGGSRMVEIFFSSAGTTQLIKAAGMMDGALNRTILEENPSGVAKI